MSKQERRVASVVIVGGGIGGIAVAMKLARVPVELTLVDARKKRLLRRGFRYGAAQESNLPSRGLHATMTAASTYDSCVSRKRMRSPTVRWRCLGWRSGSSP